MCVNVYVLCDLFRYALSYLLGLRCGLACQLSGAAKLTHALCSLQNPEDPNFFVLKPKVRCA